MLRIRLGSLAAALLLLLPGCYASRALRVSQKITRAGFDFDARGPWVLLFGPASLVVAGGNLLVGSVLPIHGGVDPREPEAQWFHAYAGPMRPAEEVAILCHRERATWVTGIRDVSAGGAWLGARHEKWHFPVCIEVLPGRYELEVQYFAREHDDDREQSVSRQAESTQPSRVLWTARAGRVYLLTAQLGKPEPSQTPPPQRHIPRSRALGTTWWGLEESDWYARIEPVGDWADLKGPLREQRRAWREWEAHRR